MHITRSGRLDAYDYTAHGLYFITICTDWRQTFFGSISNGEVLLSDWGETADRCWREIPAHYPGTTIDAFVIMPTHMHGIVELSKTLHTADAPTSRMYRPRADNNYTLGNVIGSYKAAVTREIRRTSGRKQLTVWQNGFYDHIIRDALDYNRKRNYIIDNPRRW
jgi:REP element-mobilizing transposase RayT